jgi:hypothetical protein
MRGGKQAVLRVEEVPWLAAQRQALRPLQPAAHQATPLLGH